MGMVYKAHDQLLDEPVALKILRPQIAGTEEMHARFRSEMKLARRVAHPNVCRVYEYGDDGALRYISMEFVEGQDLREVLRTRGPLTPHEAFEIAIQAGEGLEAIHEAGVIHRDLKTPNIMLGPRGVKVMDFGIAKEGGDEAAHTSSRFGTPEYMSPEQVLGEPIDFRSDIYSFGVVLFELFVGDVPFRGATPAATLMRHDNGPAALDDPEKRAALLRLPVAVWPVCRRCLSRRPQDRYESSSQMLESLRHAYFVYKTQSGDHRTLTLGSDVLEPITDSVARPLRIRRTLRRGAWIAAACAIAAGAYWSGRRAPRTPSPHDRMWADATPPPARRTPTPSSSEGRPSAASRTTDGTTSTAAGIAGLGASSDVERAEAARQLGARGENAAAAVPALRRALEDDDGLVRSSAARALGQIGTAARPATPALERALADPDERVRAAAASALAALGSLSESAVNALIVDLKDPSPQVRARAAYALSRHRRRSEKVVAALREAVSDEDESVRHAAEAALGPRR
jgi:serine/threonine protein kinase